MNVEIRRATIKDIKEILPVWGQVAGFHSELDPAFTPSPQWPREYGAYLRTLISHDDAIAVVAREQLELVELTVAANNDAIPFWERLGFRVYMPQMKRDLTSQ